MFTFLLWCVLLVLCWPLALLALVLYPLVWLLLLPFRLLGIPILLDISFLLVLPLMAWLIGRSGTSSAENALAASEWVWTTAPASLRRAMISVWIGYSMCRGPLPASTSPRGETSTILLSSTSSKPHPEHFSQAPRPAGSRTLA